MPVEQSPAKGFYHGNERPRGSKKVVRSQMAPVQARVGEAELAVVEAVDPSLAGMPDLQVREEGALKSEPSMCKQISNLLLAPSSSFRGPVSG